MHSNLVGLVMSRLIYGSILMVSGSQTDRRQRDKVISYTDAQARLHQFLCLHMICTDFVKWSFEILTHKLNKMTLHGQSRTEEN